MDSPTSEQALIGILYALYSIKSLLRQQQQQPTPQIQHKQKAILQDDDGQSTDASKTVKRGLPLVRTHSSDRIATLGHRQDHPLIHIEEIPEPEINGVISTDVKNLQRYKNVVAGGMRIRPDGRLPLPFSQSYLEKLPLDEVTTILDAIEKQTVRISKVNRAYGDGCLGVPVVFDILDYSLSPIHDPTVDVTPRQISSSEGKSCSISYFQDPRLSGQPTIVLPWARVMSVLDPRLRIALTNLSVCEGFSHLEWADNKIEAEKLCPILFADFHNQKTTEKLVDHTFRPTGQVRDMLVQHMTCARQDQLGRINQDVTRSFQPLFHATMFKPTLKVEEDWKQRIGPSGTFDSSKKRFRLKSVTVLISENSSATSNQEESDFTFLILAPSNFYEYATFLGDGSRFSPIQYASSRHAPFNDVQDAKIQIVLQIYETIEKQSLQLRDYVLRQCNNDDDISFLESDEYVDLLYDDEAFRKPSIYAWAVVCLGSLEQNLGDLLSELFLFRSEVSANNNDLERRIRQYYEATMRTSPFVSYAKFIETRGDEARLKLCAARRLRALVQQKRDEFKALRDGLFSANSVIEARRSRILAEHVRLLTFVSIFFAPLAFCVSLWSLPVIADRHRDFATPLVISTCQPIFDSLRAKILCLMANEELKLDGLANDSETTDSENTNRPKIKSSGVNWQKKAKELEVFPRRDLNPQPSEWWFIAYALMLVWRGTIRLGRRSKELTSKTMRLRIRRQAFDEGVDIEQNGNIEQSAKNKQEVALEVDKTQIKVTTIG
ncbi:hypothetical protein GLAREA_06600 [Glarea lozoyensis ATCC 20868]|uniref:Uncharacterized protein n=1 Tax=Glarea lozoyensis (strain ATCC 20868 / MF5171) TaxID=1116229 RepID=S3D548_GLAL2|nr:uncharacterized protein GLAREA_06600 [Glarea lozoyensis ATCC 20868]EPE33587.1 hypothetical protein GLAREA_06600 [Glarea lozoyensis ATCC 20868]